MDKADILDFEEQRQYAAELVQKCFNHPFFENQKCTDEERADFFSSLSAIRKLLAQNRNTEFFFFIKDLLQRAIEENKENAEKARIMSAFLCEDYDALVRFQETVFKDSHSRIRFLEGFRSMDEFRILLLLAMGIRNEGNAFMKILSLKYIGIAQMKTEDFEAAERSFNDFITEMTFSLPNISDANGRRIAAELIIEVNALMNQSIEAIQSQTRRAVKA